MFVYIIYPVKVIVNDTMTMYADPTTLTSQKVLQCYDCRAHTQDKNEDCIVPHSTTKRMHCNQNNCQSVIRSYTKVTRQNDTRLT